MNTEFEADKKKGNQGEIIFIEKIIGDNLYTHSTSENKEDYDIESNGVTYEIKSNYKDNGYLCVEEWYSRESKQKGWISTSKCDYICFISLKSRQILIYDFARFKEWYIANYTMISGKYRLTVNERTVGKYGDIWASEYRRIPLHDIPIRAMIL